MEFLEKLWSIITEMSPFLLFGFLFSGILSVLLTIETVSKYLGGNTLKSIFSASLFGIPLPLCSCGVIPVFSYLRKHGASKASTTSFLISTPQTGVDSIMVTYSLLGPIFAIARPVIALLSGIIGGIFVSLLDSKSLESSSLEDCEDDCCNEEESKVYRVLNYGFVKLPQDIVVPLFVGIITAALIFFFIPKDYFMNVGVGIYGMLIMLLLGLPSYICATASVPMALALHYSGFSMGSLIVFLMSGPATNMATISVAIKQLGKKSTMIYLSSIFICSISAGLLFDYLFPGLSIEKSLSTSMAMVPYPLEFGSAIILLLILINAYRLNYYGNTSELLIKGAHTLFIEGMTCNHCVESVTKTLNKLDGVKTLDISLNTGKIELDCLPEQVTPIHQAILDLGYKIKNNND